MFKKVASSLLFLVSYEPLITPAKWHYQLSYSNEKKNTIMDKDSKCNIKAHGLICYLLAF